MRWILFSALATIVFGCATASSQLGSVMCPEGSVITAEESENQYWCNDEGTAVGTGLIWFKNGSLSSAVRFSEGGAPISIVSFYETGEIENTRSLLSSGREISRHWYKTGVLQIYAEWKDEQLNGAYRTYHPNGQLKAEGVYIAGKLDGDWKYWEPDGTARTQPYEETPPASGTP